MVEDNLKALRQILVKCFEDASQMKKEHRDSYLLEFAELLAVTLDRDQSLSQDDRHVVESAFKEAQQLLEELSRYLADQRGIQEKPADCVKVMNNISPLKPSRPQPLVWRQVEV